MFRSRPAARIWRRHVYWRVKRTRIGAELARTGRPSPPRAGRKVVRLAHPAAASPNPCPGSETMATDSAVPSGRTTTRMTTVSSSMGRGSASAGQGQDQLWLARTTGAERSGPADAAPEAGPAGPVPTDGPCPCPGNVLVPPAVVAPPAYAGALPTTNVSPVMSTGAFGGACRTTTVAACAGGAARAATRLGAAGADRRDGGVTRTGAAAGEDSGKRAGAAAWSSAISMGTRAASRPRRGSRRSAARIGSAHRATAVAATTTPRPRGARRWTPSTTSTMSWRRYAPLRGAFTRSGRRRRAGRRTRPCRCRPS